MTEHAVGTREQWLSARKELLDAEKEHARRGDELARRRRELRWEPLEKEYTFETAVAPFGRHEDTRDPGAWRHRHDEYEAGEAASQ